MTPPDAANATWDFLCRHRHRLLGAAVALALAAVAAVAGSYLLYPGYLDHGEPSVALISWRLLEGIPAFTALDDPRRIANLYGPVTHVIHAASFALAGPSIAAGKVAAVVAAMLIPAAVFMGQRQRGIEAALIGLVIAAALVLLHVPTSIWNRPDSFLALMAALAVWAANAADPARAEWPKSVLIAVCGGLAVGLKIHGGIYVAPVVVWHCLNPHRGVRVFAVMCAVGAGVALVPFAFPVFPLANHLAWLAPVIGKESPPAYVLNMLRYAAIYLVPVAFFAAAAIRAAGAMARRETAYLATYVACLAAAIYLGAKPGAGIHYLYPFTALAIDLTLRHALRVTGRRIAVWGTIVAFATIVLAIGVPVQKRYYRALHWQEVSRIGAEIRTVMAAYPGRTIEMGVGGNVASYHRTFYKTILVLAGNPYTLDAAVIIEWSKLGIPLADATLALIRGCSTDLWLIPKGERPFTMVGYYGNRIFEPAFVDAFHGSYAKAKSLEFFDLWACKR